MVRPYNVSEPILSGGADPDVIAFAQKELASMAKRVISRMQRQSASGVFHGEAEGLRSLWDDWCWYQTYHDSDTTFLSDAMEQTLDSFIDAVVEVVPPAKMALLEKALNANDDSRQKFELHLRLAYAMVRICMKVGINKFDQMLHEFTDAVGLNLREALRPMRTAYNYARQELDLADKDVSEMDDNETVIAYVRAIRTREGIVSSPSLPTVDSDPLIPLPISDVVREIICTAASRRSMSRFEVY